MTKNHTFNLEFLHITKLIYDTTVGDSPIEVSVRVGRKRSLPFTRSISERVDGSVDPTGASGKDRLQLASGRPKTLWKTKGTISPVNSTTVEKEEKGQNIHLFY